MNPVPLKDARVSNIVDVVTGHFRLHRRAFAGSISAVASWVTPAVAWSAESAESPLRVGGNKASSYAWVLANVSYAGMRAQDHPSTGWRALAFIFGFPGTLISYFAVSEGSNRAYGIVLPPRSGK